MLIFCSRRVWRCWHAAIIRHIPDERGAKGGVHATGFLSFEGSRHFRDATVEHVTEKESLE